MNKLRRILLTLLVLSVTFLYGCGGENSEAAPETDTAADPTEEEAAPVYIACLNEMPGLGELAAEYDQSEFQIIGIVSDVREGEDQTLVENLVQETGADYPHLLANDTLDQALLANVSGVPTTFFFDGDGAYLGGVVGAAEKSKWEELIHELMEEQ